jgi:hypothetical protein
MLKRVDSTRHQADRNPRVTFTQEGATASFRTLADHACVLQGYGGIHLHSTIRNYPGICHIAAVRAMEAFCAISPPSPTNKVSRQEEGGSDRCQEERL